MRIATTLATALCATLPVVAQPSCDGGSFYCGTTISVVIASGSCPTSCQEYSQTHTFNTFGNSTLATLTVTPDGFAPAIEIESADGTVLHRRDGRAGETLRLGVVLEPAVYRARVIALPAGATGTYAIRLGCLLADANVFCTPDETTLCLYNRFSVKVSLRAHADGPSVEATALRGSDRYGVFTAPMLTADPDNPEVMVKVLDGRPVNGRWWVFFGGVTGFDYEINVRDTFYKREKTYTKADVADKGGIDLETFSDR